MDLTKNYINKKLSKDDLDNIHNWADYNPYPDTPGNMARGAMELPQMTQPEIDKYYADAPEQLGMIGMGSIESAGKGLLSMMSPEAQAMRQALQKRMNLGAEESGGKVISAMPKLIADAAPEAKVVQEPAWHETFMNRFEEGSPEEKLAQKALDKAGQSKHPYESTNLLPSMPTTGNKNFEITKPGQVIGHEGIMEPFGNKLTEPIPWSDDKYKVTKSALQQAKEKNLPVELNTSSDLIGRNDYIDSLPRGSKVNMYLNSKDPELNRLIFPGNPSRLRLENAVKRLKENGIEVNTIEPSREDLMNAVKNKTKTKGLKFGAQDDPDLDGLIKQLINNYYPGPTGLKE